MRRGKGAFEIFARTGAGINKSAVPKPMPRSQIEIVPLALRVWAKHAADIGAFIPVEA
jgi:hypothetical protein